VKSITIAIDGYSACGKSTLAKALARELHYLYIDSGAMYRAVTYFFLQHSVDVGNERAVARALEKIHIDFQKNDGEFETLLNGKSVESLIRKMEVSERVSDVAAVSAVRRAMVKQQRQLGEKGGIVMDGRDIGTVVFPHAKLKIFLTADTGERIRRRFEELRQKSQTTDREIVRRNLARRDHIDSNRADSPLRQAEDAVVVDNTNLSKTEQLAMVLALARKRIEKAGREDRPFKIK